MSHKAFLPRGQKYTGLLWYRWTCYCWHELFSVKLQRWSRVSPLSQRETEMYKTEMREKQHFISALNSTDGVPEEGKNKKTPCERPLTDLFQNPQRLYVSQLPLGVTKSHTTTFNLRGAQFESRWGVSAFRGFLISRLVVIKCIDTFCGLPKKI